MANKKKLNKKRKKEKLFFILNKMIGPLTNQRINLLLWENKRKNEEKNKEIEDEEVVEGGGGDRLNKNHRIIKYDTKILSDILHQRVQQINQHNNTTTNNNLIPTPPSLPLSSSYKSKNNIIQSSSDGRKSFAMISVSLAFLCYFFISVLPPLHLLIIYLF